MPSPLLGHLPAPCRPPPLPRGSPLPLPIPPSPPQEFFVLNGFVTDHVGLVQSVGFCYKCVRVVSSMG